jgi:hypothetical protein
LHEKNLKGAERGKRKKKERGKRKDRKMGKKIKVRVK